VKALVSTPRPAPGRLLPAAGAALVLVLALPIFLIAGWPLAGWALGAVLWVSVEAIGLLVTRAASTGARLASSGVQAFGLFFKTVGVLVVLVAVAVSDPHLAVAATLVYALAYTFELGLSLLTYFGTPR
jgi:hypothetical protein